MATIQPSRRQTPVSLTYEEKKAICLWHGRDPSLPQRKLAERAAREFALTRAPAQGTISTILKDAKNILTTRVEDLKSKRLRAVTFPNVDKALANWVLLYQDRRVTVSGDLIRMKAQRLAAKSGVAPQEMLAFSNGWLDAFKARHNFKEFKLHGESGSVCTQDIPNQIASVRDVLKLYALQDIYKMDETGLFLKMCPDKNIAQRQKEG
ncbi:hypothetical protein PC110_g13473 [Phytophthora cactorum]|uniref:HTH CENPB-type domain-containing protein n=2 Tax=Phytophthora cactorum TaxID=29920 RepID=A0A329S0E7_9STRA|nr:hypothetical protein PC110_g13473 [Phytophthora cactorum]